MKLTEEQKRKMMVIAERRWKTKIDEWWAHDFLGGWNELDEDEEEEDAMEM